MQKEFSSAAGFKEWWSAYRPSLPDSFQKFNDLRVALLKTHYPTTTHRIATHFGGGLRVEAGQTVIIPVSFRPGLDQKVTYKVRDQAGQPQERTARQTNIL